MSASPSSLGVSVDRAGNMIHGLIRELFPLCRSITGDGVRQTLEVIGRHIPLVMHEVASGTKVFDWEIPREWNIRQAYIQGPNGQRVVDFRNSNLHVLNYSAPIDRTISLDELKQHLFTLPDHPDWIPYKTSYYEERWGFCLSHNQLKSLAQGDYRVRVDSTLEKGHLTYAECFIPGETRDEVLVSVHICHPSLANDNLSGLCTAAFIAKHLGERKRRYSYRFLFVPGTIGPIAWLSRNKNSITRIRHGIVLSGIGDSGQISYKKSRRGNAEIDQVVQYVLETRGLKKNVREFSPYGYDERQYCSPGFNMPVGSLSRTPYAEYPEYHTSADNVEFVRSEAVGDSFAFLVEVFDVLEGNCRLRNLVPKCEPQLGRRGLYNEIGPNQLAMLWVLNYSDNEHSLLDIARMARVHFSSIRAAADILTDHGLLCQVAPSKQKKSRHA